MVHISDGWFLDSHGRHLILRGVNLGGSSKVPKIPNGATHIPGNFDADFEKISFVGRPFEVMDAKMHFDRIRSLGFNNLRFIVTWEAVEHTKPAGYDLEYLDYLEEIIRLAGDYDLWVIIDFHQDVWSRYSGGDGAPGWTFEKAGLDLKKFDDAEAAITMQRRGSDRYGHMHWLMNHFRYASATMFTLFFGGRTFAPELQIEGQNIQDYLQEHYLRCLEVVAKRAARFPHVIGFDVMNEPSYGYIGNHLNKRRFLPLGVPAPSPFESILLANGFPIKSSRHSLLRFVPHRKVLLNPDGIDVFLPDADDVWKQHGVWEIDARGHPILLKPDYFCFINNKPVSSFRDFYVPFLTKAAERLHAVRDNFLIFTETDPENPQEMALFPSEIPNVVNATHWYDVLTLWRCSYNPYITLNSITRNLVMGRERVVQAYSDQIRKIKDVSESKMGNCPTYVGEFGLPMNFDGGRSFIDGDYSSQIQALSNYYDAMDQNLVNSAQWVYTPDNCNKWGDLWNKEDFSIYCPAQMDDEGDIYSGLRASEGFCRPYAIKTAGKPIAMTFELRTRVFEFRFTTAPAIRAPTLIFVPKIQYPNGYQVLLTSGDYLKDHSNQLLRIENCEPGVCQVVIQPEERLRKLDARNN